MFRSHAAESRPFSLVEWMLVFVILGILATLAVPKFRSDEGRASLTKSTAPVEPARFGSLKVGALFAVPGGREGF
jgi:Tfp pilus assembly major pilin PilA